MLAIFPDKIRLAHLRISEQAKNIPVALPSFPVKIRGKSVQGFLSYDRKNKHTKTDRKTEITTFYT